MTWVKGQSGNPGGETAGKQKLITEKMIAFVDDAVANIVAKMKSPDDSVSLRASQDIVDRVFGKPKQALEHDATEKVVNMILKIAEKNVP